MKADPIIKEIHQARERLSKKFDFNIRKIFDDVKQREKKHKERVINLKINQKTND